MSNVVESATKDAANRDLGDYIRLMAGSMLTYDSLVASGAGTEVQAMQLVASKQREKLTGCMMLPLAFVYFSLYCTLVMLHEDIPHVHLIESQLRDAADEMFGEVEDIDSLWDVILDSDGGFVGTFFRQEDDYGNGFSKGNSSTPDKWGMWGRFAQYNQLQGAVRFQQSRKTEALYGLPYQCSSTQTCSLCRRNAGFQPDTDGSSQDTFDCGNWSRRLDSPTADSFKDSMASTAPRRLSLMSYPMESTVPEIPEPFYTGFFRFWLYPSASQDEIVDRLQYFRDRQWLDGNTETFTIRLYLLNAELGQPNMEQLSVNFYMSAGGSIYYTRDVQAIFFDIFPSNLCMGIDGLWFAVLCFTSLLQLYRLWHAIRETRVGSYVLDFKNMLEMVTIAIGWYCCYQFYLVYQIKRETSDIMEGVRSHGWNLDDKDEDVVNDMFVAGEDAASKSLSLRLIFANYTIVLMCRFFANFGAQPRLSIITRTLTSLVADLFHFVILYIPAFMVYVASGVLLWGRRVEGHATFVGSLGSTFRMALEGEYEWEDFKLENYWTSAFWIWSFIVFMFMLMINLLLAIILDVYNEVQRNEKSSEAVWDTLGQFWQRFLNLKYWVKEAELIATCKDPTKQEGVIVKETFKASFPEMPQCQNDLCFTESAKEMEVQAEKDLDTKKLLKMAGSLMESVGEVNTALRTITEEESKNPLQSWTAPKKMDLPAGQSSKQQGENFLTAPVVTKGNRPPRLAMPEDTPPFSMDAIRWQPEWLKEVDTMLTCQRQWIEHANWQLDLLQWNLQNAHVAKLQADKAQANGSGLSNLL